MKLVFLGTGGAMPTPRPFCACDLCEKARCYGEPYKRNSSSIYIEDAKAIIDCPEDIGDSLNRRRIMKVDNLFITHWHPDHTFGLRPLLESNYNFITEKPQKQINIYIPSKVYDQLNKAYPNFYYFEHIAKMCVVHKLENRQSVTIDGCLITAIGYEGDDSTTYGYLVEQNNKSVMYAPCDTLCFDYNIKTPDILIDECGILSPEVKTEVSFDQLLNRIEKLGVERTILTHIEEIELNRFGLDHYEKLKEKHSQVNFDYAYDGMCLVL